MTMEDPVRRRAPLIRALSLGVILLALTIGRAEAGSKLYISEYSVTGTTAEIAQVAVEPSITDQVVDFSKGATLSSEFNEKTRLVRLICDIRCSIRFGAAPTAKTSNKMLPAMLPEYFGVQGHGRISVIANPRGAR